MNREQQIRRMWDRANLLSLSNATYQKQLEQTWKTILEQDKVKQDVTSQAVLPKNKPIKAGVFSREQCIAAGIEEITFVLEKQGIACKPLVNDGMGVKKNGYLLELKGNAQKIMAVERALLNVLQRMCSIATATNKLVLECMPRCFVAGTRKSLLPLLDKKAIMMGGGISHRVSLADGMLIKDNHLAIISNHIPHAIQQAEASPSKYIEIEVKTKQQAIIAATSILTFKVKKQYAIMFDNFTSLQIRNTLRELGHAKHKILFEASGGINQKNIKQYARTGVDIISSGAVTHSVKSVDLSLRIL